MIETVADNTARVNPLPTMRPKGTVRLTGDSPEISALQLEIDRVARSDAKVLITGESGIGKSECALDLIGRGHRLVADDTVEVKVRGEAVLIGSCPDLTRHYVEIRGLGLVNVTDLFGVAATRSSKRIELVVQLERWELGRDYDRLGLTTDTQEVLGVSVPLIRMPVAPGRNVAMLVEVAARNSLLRSRGRHAAQLLAGRLEHRLARALDREDRQESPGRPRDAEEDD